MKKNKLITPILILVCILGLYGVAFSGGGEGGAYVCDPTLLPNSGPFLYGTFTVARFNKNLCHYNPGLPFCGYDVQIMLEYRLTKAHLFSFQAVLGTGDLCGYDSPTLEQIFVNLPCSLGVGDAFGFDPAKYQPVISDISIIKKDSCKADVCNPQNPNYATDCWNYNGIVGGQQQTIYYSPDEMISGLITIRLVPVKK